MGLRVDTSIIGYQLRLMGGQPHRLLALLLLCLISFACSAPRVSRANFIDPSLSLQRSDSLLIHHLEQDGFPCTVRNRAKLFTSGKAKFDDLFTSIRKAQKHIHMEYFNFRNDSISAALFEVLQKKVAQGVEVRILFDDFGNWSNNRPLRQRYVDTLRARGIDIVKFDPIVFPYVNHASSRDHRKIVVVDGEVGYVGGMNVADYYINGLPNLGPWLDMHLRIRGEAVGDLQRIFLDMWNDATKQSIAGASYFPKAEQSDSLGRELIAIVDRKPRRSPASIREAYATSIAMAEGHVHIINPYFVPTTSIRKALKYALSRGTTIRIMVPEKSDIPFTPDAMLHELRKLSKRGAEVYLYQGGFHHSKAMTVDNLFCTIGSANLNSRSLRYDYETNAFVFDAALTARVDSVFYQDMKHCIRLDDQYWRERSLWRKFVGWFANLLTPFL